MIADDLPEGVNSKTCPYCKAEFSYKASELKEYAIIEKSQTPTTKRLVTQCPKCDKELLIYLDK